MEVLSVLIQVPTCQLSFLNIHISSFMFIRINDIFNLSQPMCSSITVITQNSSIDFVQDNFIAKLSLYIVTFNPRILNSLKQCIHWLVYQLNKL